MKERETSLLCLGKTIVDVRKGVNRTIKEPGLYKFGFSVSIVLSFREVNSWPKY